MILGRQEAFASRNTVRLAVIDALGMASGFLLALFALGSVREILGEGALFGVSLFGPDFEPWVIMILPPGGFLTLGLLLLFFNWFTEHKNRLAERLAEGEAT
jgi:Na+-translocating ferredoxin:NAD+ oxidoreductase subunit E